MFKNETDKIRQGHNESDIRKFPLLCDIVLTTATKFP